MNRQANLCHALVNDFAHSWLELYRDARLGTPILWPKEYHSPTITLKKVKKQLERTVTRRKLVEMFGNVESNIANT